MSGLGEKGWEGAWMDGVTSLGWSAASAGQKVVKVLIIDAATNKLLFGEYMVGVEVHFLAYCMGSHFRAVLGTGIGLSYHQIYCLSGEKNHSKTLLSPIHSITSLSDLMFL